jgi:hypothetical protein
MNTRTLFAFIMTLLFAHGFTSLSFAASDEDIENACMNKADEQNVADDKYDDFIGKCIEDAKAKGGE